MKQLITTSALSLLLLGSVANKVVAKTSPNFPNGFKPKTIGGISFTENKGQVHDQNNIARPDILYSGTDGQLVFHLKNNGISYQLNKVDGKKEQIANALANEKVVNDAKNTIYRLDINWLNANTNASILKGLAKQDVTNYYLGHCPKGALDVKSYDNLTYQNLYSGIDLKWYQKDGHLKYDYLVAAGANYKQIQLELNGATAISINTKGELVLKTPLGNIIEQAPLVSQNGKILKARWQLKNNIATYEIDNLNPNQAFIIDPAVRTWGTYYGGGGADYGNTCSADGSGNIYLAGSTDTYSIMATTGSYQSIVAGTEDAFLVKFNALGFRQWGTYLGGSTHDIGKSCATDGSGNILLTGFTYSGNFPHTNGCFQSTNSGNADGFITKLNSVGLIQWSTYLGGSSNENGNSCAIDGSNGDIYVAGETSSNDLPLVGTSYQTIYGDGGRDAFLFKFNSAGACQWSTYCGDAGYDLGYGCAIDNSGNVLLVGWSNSNSGISTIGSHQTNNGGNYDAFLVKFNANGLRQWGTFYGGSGNELGRKCITDTYGNIYIVGKTTTSSSAIATVNSHQPAFGGGSSDAFLAKFDANGIRLWGTYYGGTGAEEGYSCVIDLNNNTYISGFTSSNTGTVIATVGSHQQTMSGIGDAYLAKFDGAGMRQWGTYYGDTGGEDGYACSVGVNGNVYLAGLTSPDINTGNGIATPSSYQPSYGSFNAYDAFLVQFYECQAPTMPINITAQANQTICENNSTILSASSINAISWYTNATGGSAISTGTNFITPILSSGTYTYFAEANTCTNSIARTAITITVNPNPTITVNSGAICSGGSFTMVPSGATNYTFSNGSAIVSPASTSSYTVIGANAQGCIGSVNSNVTVNPNPTVTVNSGAICAGNSFTLLPSGANSYSYSSGTNIVTPTINTSYTITGINTFGCSNSVASNVTVNPNPTLAVNSGAICSGDSFTLVPSGATNYTFSSGSAIVSPASTSSYTVIGANAQGCIGSVNSNVTVNPNPTVTVNSGAICAGNSFTLLPSGANSYSYSSGNNIVTPTSNTSYVVTGTSLFGCTDTAVSNVTVNNLPTITINSSTNLLCVGQTASLTASGAISYNWSTGATVATIAVMPATTTNYTVSGSDVNGCSNSSNITQQVTICTGISNVASTTQTNLFTVYPNPTTGNLSIELADQQHFLTGTETQLKLQVTNALGEVLLLIPFTANKAMTLNMYNFNNGIYFLSVLDNITLIKTQKIIKQ